MGVEVIFSIFNLYWILLTFILGITFETHKLNIPNYEKRGIKNVKLTSTFKFDSYDILGARMLWKPKEARILKNFIDQPV
jgi:hypothetical protein